MKSEKKLAVILPDSYSLCKKWLLKLYNNLNNDKVLLKKYSDIFAEQKEAHLLKTVENVSTIGNNHYIAHHPVFREDRKNLHVEDCFWCFFHRKWT